MTCFDSFGNSVCVKKQTYPLILRHIFSLYEKKSKQWDLVETRGLTPGYYKLKQICPNFG